MNALRGGKRMSANIYYSLESVLASLTEVKWFLSFLECEHFNLLL